jgi:pantoate--beta-alanine ligase
VEILGAPTIRDHDGLALSSRNKYLGARERSFAPKLYESLKLAKQRIEKGERDFESIQQNGMQLLERAGFQPDYFAIREATDLAPLRAESRDLIVLAAARIGQARLIDNVHAHVIEHH